MAGISRDELRRKEAKILSACIEQLLSRPLESITVKSVAATSGMTAWAAQRAVQRIARDRDHLIRRAAQELAGRLGQRIAAVPEPGSTVSATIEAAVTHMVGIMRSSDFRRFFRLVVAQQGYHPWLQSLYEAEVAAAFCRALEECVRIAGRRSGIAACFRPGAPRQVLRRLEQDICLPALLPGQEDDDGDAQALVRSVAQQAFALTYAWDLGAAA